MDQVGDSGESVGSGGSGDFGESSYSCGYGHSDDLYEIDGFGKYHKTWYFLGFSRYKYFGVFDRFNFAFSFCFKQRQQTVVYFWYGKLCVVLRLVIFKFLFFR